MPVSQLDTIAGSTNPWDPVVKKSVALKRDSLNAHLIGQFTSNARVLAESDWVYLQALLYAEQIHPWTVDQVAALGPIEGRNAMRWTLEGPLSPGPGEPANCAIFLEVAHSLTATPGSDWREFKPGKYKLRSYRMRLTIARPSLDFDFRIYRLATRATRVAPPQRDAVGAAFFSHG